jgi:hypothetical protein
MALIKVDSPDELCMIVSVQNISCPVADLEDRGGGGGGFEGIRQTVLTLNYFFSNVRLHNLYRVLWMLTWFLMWEDNKLFARSLSIYGDLSKSH